MVQTLVGIGIMAIGIPAFVFWRYQPPKPLDWRIALRYLLQCVILFLCGLLAMRDPLLADWALLILAGAALFSAALVIVIAGALC